MNNKSSNKSGKLIRERLAVLGRKNTSKRRIYIDKHSEVLGYLYDTEQLEINDMIETAKRFGRKENS
jgi:hypothetical protein